MDKTKHAAIVLFSAGLIFALASSAPAQSTNADFQQAVAAYQQSHSYADIENVIKLAAAMPQPPSIPTEARRHFVMGQTMFKDAKSPADSAQAGDEFLQAARLAPWWPEARYNTAAALEAAGDYANAIANLKIYQMFKLPDAEAQTIQDKMWALEAKQKMAAKDAEAVAQKKAEADRQQEAERQKAAEAVSKSQETARAQELAFIGKWYEKVGDDYLIEISRSSDNYSARTPEIFTSYDKNTDGRTGRPLPPVPRRGTISLSDFRIRGRNMQFEVSRDSVNDVTSSCPIAWRVQERIYYDLTISDDGRKLTGNKRFVQTLNGEAGNEKTADCELFRRD
jgi:hypothetical protein